MAFHVVLDLVPPEQSDLVIGAVHVNGEPDKPAVDKLPGRDQKLQDKLHACHIVAWKIIATGIAQQLTGVRMRDAAMAVFKFNEFQARGVSAVQIKEFMEESIKSTLKDLQQRVSNYYAGPGRANMSGGGKMGSAIRMLNEMHESYKSPFPAMGQQTVNPEYKAKATPKQIELFRAGYDESPFHTPRGEVARPRGVRRVLVPDLLRRRPGQHPVRQIPHRDDGGAGRDRRPYPGRKVMGTDAAKKQRAWRRPAPGPHFPSNDDRG